MPIFREESIFNFENLYNQNERNFPKQDIKPNFVRTKNKIPRLCVASRSSSRR